MKLKFAIGLFVLAWSTQGKTLTLQEYLKTVESKHKTIQSYNVSKEAVKERREATDTQLVPTLTAGVGYLNDKSPLGQFAQLGATQTEAKDLKLGLSKKFSTGTGVSLSAGATEVENQGNIFIPSFQNFSYGSLGVAVNQSLWKDAFGRATHLRWQREDSTTAIEVGRYDLQTKALLVEAESVFWDYLYQQENTKIAQGSLERAKRIEAWTRRRVNDGISDRADLLSTQALTAARQLLLVSAEDELSAAKRQIRAFLEIPDSEALPEINGNISQERSIKSMVDGHGGKVMALDAYLALLNSKAMSLVSRETEEAFRPDLTLSGSYNTNNFQPDRSISDATRKWADNDLPTWKVGLNMTYLFDTGVKSSAKSAARKDALAAKLQGERKLIDSETSWIELNRRYSEMKKRIETATEISRLQMAAAKAQADLFNKGRSITANVIKAEEDAGAAELNLTKLKSEQRKMEAQGRLFIVVEEQL